MTYFWIDKLSELYKNNKFMLIIPNSDMDYEEKANTITRLCLLLFLILLIINYKLALIPIIIIILIIIIYYLVENKKKEQFVPNINDMSNLSIMSSFNESLNFNDTNTVKSNNELDSLISSYAPNYENKLFLDNDLNYENNATDRRSPSNITYDLGNTVAFADNLYNPVLTCKEDNLNCYNKEEDLSKKR